MSIRDLRLPLRGPGSACLRVGLAALLLALAVWNPALTLPRTVVDAVVVLDITQSMNVADYRLDGQDVTRLAYAKEALRRTLLDLPCGSQIGWGVFTEYRILLLAAPAEVCANYGDMLAVLDRIDNRMAWANASEIAKGVANAVQTVHSLSDQPGLLFVTDGQEAPPRNPAARRPVVPGNGAARGELIGVGGDEPRAIPKTDPEGRSQGTWREEEVVQRASGDAGASVSGRREHLSALHETDLIALAKEDDLGYRRLVSLADVGTALRRPEFARRRPGPQPLAPLFALGALLIVVTLFARTPWGRPRRARRSAPPGTPPSGDLHE